MTSYSNAPFSISGIVANLFIIRNLRTTTIIMKKQGGREKKIIYVKNIL